VPVASEVGLLLAELDVEVVAVFALDSRDDSVTVSVGLLLAELDVAVFALDSRDDPVTVGVGIDTVELGASSVVNTDKAIDCIPIWVITWSVRGKSVLVRSIQAPSVVAPLSNCLIIVL